MGLALAGMAEAQPAELVSVLERPACRSWAEPDWTTPERWVWSQSCDGRLADLQALSKDDLGAGSRADPNGSATAPEDRTLRATFLETILLNPPYRDALKPRGLHVHGAVITGRLDLSNARLEFPLYLEHSRFENAVTLRDLRSSSFVDLGHSRFEADVDMQRVRIDNGLLSEGAEFLGLTLHGAEIRGQLLLNRASFSSRLDLESARVARDVLMRGTRLETLKLVGARIEGALLMVDAEVSGRVNADSLHLGQSLFLKEAQLEQLNLSTARIEGKIIGRGLAVKGDLLGDGIVAAGWVDLSAVSAASVDLDFAKIGGKTDLRKARIEKDLGLQSGTIAGSLILGTGSRIGGRTNLERTSIGGNLVLRGHEQVGDLTFRGTQIDGQVAIGESNFEKGLVLDSTRIGESLFLRGLGEPLAELSLRGVEIGGQLEITNQHIVQRLHLHELHIADSLYLQDVVGPHIAQTEGRCVTQRNGGREASIHRTDIGGDLDLSGSRLSCLDLSGSTVSGSLLLYSPKRGPVRWRNASSLVLRDARAGTVADDGRLDNWPTHLDLAGFHFTRFARLPRRGDVEAGERPTKWYRAWLGRSAYSAESYQRLADYLTRNGRLHDANDIRFTSRERYRTEQASGLEWVELTLLKAIIGYGYGHKVFYSLIWVLVFVLIGAAAVWANGEGRRRGVTWTVLYSFDHLLPILRLDERNYRLQARGATKYYMYFHTLVGYILASFVLAGLAGLTN